MKNLQLFSRFFLALTILATVAAPVAAQNAVPMLINYEGELRNPTTGEPVADGSYDMLLRIYDVESGGAALWEGTHTAANGNAVEVANGIFSVTLGSGAGNALDLSVFNGADRWLEIEVGTETLSPRQKITSTAFSFVSQQAIDADTVDGMQGADLEESPEIDADIATHAAIADAHHAKYMDSEAVAAMGPVDDGNPLNHDKTLTLPWDNITDVPAGFADGEDNDSTYTAGAGLSLLDTQFNVTFDGSGAANSVARSDHHHDGAYAPEAHTHDAGTIVSGMLDTGRFSAYDDLATEGHLDGDAGTDLMTIDGGKGTYWALGGNGGTNPVNHFVGTTDDRPLDIKVNNGRALRLEPGSSPNIIAGYVTNSAEAGAVGATVGGGGEAGFANRVTDDFGTVGGGRNNQAGDDAGTTSDRAYASVGGGAGNLASGMYATVGGGLGNQAMADYATIAGGARLDPGNPLMGNSVFDRYGSIGGGGNNRAGSDDGDPTNTTYATVGGGGTNWATGQGATVGGGLVNEASGLAATIPGGDSNTASGDYATIGGGQDNAASGSYATVGGGVVNTASGGDATVGGGWSNTASGYNATVGGGVVNTANGDNAAVGGGYSNAASGDIATVGGGDSNAASTANATVGGGYRNTASGMHATVAGGRYNTASGEEATVGGGYSNSASGGTYGTATVGGGFGNTASGEAATVGGGVDNTAGGWSATVPGGLSNTAGGDYSFAAGRRAEAYHPGSFVWADSQDADIASTKADEVTFRCLGGVRFTSGGGGANQTVLWNPGDSLWSFTSDRNLKENFVEVDARDVLDKLSALPIAEWNFKGYSQRHVGPVAQDFHALFPLGGSDTMIDSGDLQGVSLAAIQGLHKIVQEKDAEISSLESRIEALEALVEKLAESQAGGE